MISRRGQARFAWRCPHIGFWDIAKEAQRRRHSHTCAKKPGPRWGNPAPQLRCGARPMAPHRASRRTCPDQPFCTHQINSNYSESALGAGIVRTKGIIRKRAGLEKTGPRFFWLGDKRQVRRESRSLGVCHPWLASARTAVPRFWSRVSPAMPVTSAAAGGVAPERPPLLA